MLRKTHGITWMAALAMALLLGCGGGGGGSSMTGMPGGGSEMSKPEDPMLRATYSRGNPTAEDLNDHWNDPERLRQALGLSVLQSASDAQERIRGLLESVGGDTEGTGTRLRNVRSQDIEVVGEKDGIVYGQWKGGPAGTLDIDFDWRFAENADATTRAIMERAGKAWSYRLRDDFGTHEAKAGRVINQRVTGLPRVTRTLDEDVTANDLLIFVIDEGIPQDGTSTGLWHGAEGSENDFRPWLGAIELARRHYRDGEVMGHEIGHVLGIYRASRNQAYARYVNDEDGTFEGPAAMRANNGEPVPFQWRDANGNVVEPGTPGARFDDGHPAVCSSIMSYCRERPSLPGEIDFAILEDMGYEILEEETASEPELYGYGAWGEYSAWGVGVERVLGPGDNLRAGADAFGVPPGASLTESTVLEGEVTWTGSLLGVDTGHAGLPPVFGNAELRISLAELTGDARFNNLVVDANGASRAFRAPNLEYAVDVTGNSFSDAENRVSGRFFGPAHEEMAGVLNDRNVGLLAGFGGSR